jgi:Flp pilus assembly protein TadB
VNVDTLTILTAVVSAATAGLIVWMLFPPPRPLRARVTRHLSPGPIGSGHQPTANAVTAVFGPVVRAAASRLGSILDRTGSAVTVVKLRQAGWAAGDESAILNRYRLGQLRSVAVGVILGLAMGQILGMALIPRMALVGLGFVVGATREKGRVDKLIEHRREMMRIELYTVNQLLAMRVRAGGGVVHAIQATVSRGRGEVVGELADALRLHRAGWRAGDALRRTSELTPEPFCGRTYRLLASAEERGADLASALLGLSEDVRESRREAIKRSATKRRAAMLIPTIAILAPVLILFVAAPLPYLITGWR